MDNETIESMKQWRHAIHQEPELAYEENKTSALVSKILKSLNLDVHENIAQTGVVGVLRKGNCDAAKIALRADMDALPIQEQTSLPYASKINNVMHACGHDGHTAMLLGAAMELSKIDGLNGTVYFIFQPAEENEAGAKRMIEEGLFDRFPADVVFALHNAPGIPVGHMAACPGPMLAAFSTFECRISGVAAHSSTPHMGVDSIEVAGEIIRQWQSIGRRLYTVKEQPIISTTQINAGDAFNVIAAEAIIKGSTRCLSSDTQTTLPEHMRETCQAIAQQYGARCEFEYQQRYPVLVNAKEWVDFGMASALDCVAIAQYTPDIDPLWGSEDFAFMLQEKPGAYFLLGNGSDGTGSCMLHNPHYDFNDQVLPVGAKFWVKLTTDYLQKFQGPEL